MNPGILRLRGTYQAPLAPSEEAPRRGTSGASEPAYGAPSPIWLAQLAVRGTVTEIAGGRRVTADTVFLARWLAALSEGGRIAVDGRSYDILAVAPAPKTPFRSWVHLECRHVKGVNPTGRTVTAFVG